MLKKHLLLLSMLKTVVLLNIFMETFFFLWWIGVFFVFKSKNNLEPKLLNSSVHRVNDELHLWFPLFSWLNVIPKSSSKGS